MTTAEERSQMGLWSMMGAPLIISADLRVMARNAADPHVAASLAILGNARAIAIDQDPLGAGGYRVLRDSSADDVGVDVALKPLADGGFAFLILNKGPIAIDYALPLATLGVSAVHCPLTLTDIWSGEVQTVDADGAVISHIASHDNAMYRAAPAACDTLAPTGQIAVAQAEFAQAPLCLEAGDDGGVTTESCSKGASQLWTIQANGHVRQVGADVCLSAMASTRELRVAVCRDPVALRLRYHRNGSLTTNDGRCLAVDTGKVGNGGLIGQQGAHLKIEACRAFAPDQVFSAPHLQPPPV